MRARLAALALVVGLVPLSASADDTAAAPSAKMADIQRLLELTGAAQMGDQMLDRMLEIQRRSVPQAPNAFWQELRAEMDTRELMEQVTVIWDKHFTHEEIKGLLAFWESPVGSRLREKQPLILMESMSVGEAWGIRAGRKVQERMKLKGYAPPST